MIPLVDKDIQYLKNVGVKRAKLFKKLGINNAGALLRFYPKSYEDWSNYKTILNAQINTTCCIKAKLKTPVKEVKIRKGLTLFKCLIYDDTGEMDIIIFNNKYAALKLNLEDTYCFYGKVTGNIFKKSMESPMFEKYNNSYKIRPIYKQTKGLTSRYIGITIKELLKDLEDNIRDIIPISLRDKYNLCNIEYALKKIHNPQTFEELEIAKKRLVFEEFFLLQVGLLKLKGNKKIKNNMILKKDYTEQFLKIFKFELTSAQIRVINECLNDMKANITMNRLIQGDVGSGKTAVAATVCFNAIKNKMQCAFMAPTEILAEQHYNYLLNLFNQFNINVKLITSSTSKKNKKVIEEDLKNGNIDLIIGTHALISDNIIFKNLGLVITDEQHRFGVKQRASLSAKGKNPHTMIMSATPIPRTLALMIYGDLDISVIDELPPLRKKIDTFCINGAKRKRAFNFIKKEIDKGHQAFIVCPLVEESEELNLISAEKYAYELSTHDFNNYKVGLLHGKIKSHEKEEIMREFLNGNIDILVATIVIEVGVNIQNATIMYIENAERFGLSQLHQLRGRVGRSKYKSYCILVSDSKSENVIKRFTTMCMTNDGFKVADEDLKLRGPGDFFGSRQHGLPELKIANMISDTEYLIKAKEAAKTILDDDFELIKEENKYLKQSVNTLFEDVGNALS